MISTEASSERALETARELMGDFAARTGLSSAAPPRRYLWTDAFAVCNFLELARATGRSVYADLALRLIDQVHQILGHAWPGGPKAGWLSGLAEHVGAAHPTIGGLRIGKKLPERRLGEPLDEDLEWDRDGQYFHYLTKWMHALDQAARATGAPRLNVWARELAVVAHRAFSFGPRGGRRMVWKMSADLTRPLVSSMGQHDALDGLITAIQLQATAADLGQGSQQPLMTELVADFAAMVEGHALATSDPLGIGGLLTDAARVAQLGRRRETGDGELLDRLLVSALEGLPRYIREGHLEQPPSSRLAFRELGLSIGIHALDSTREALARAGFATARTPLLLEALARCLPLAAVIESFWLDHGHRQAPSWTEHHDINDVMLATSLVPGGFLLGSSS